MKIKLPSDFDPKRYLLLNPDVSRAIKTGHIKSASEHYILFGHKEGRAYLNGKIYDDSLPSDFNIKMYLDLNADVAKSIESGECPSAETHYLNFGRNEGRLYNLSSPAAEKYLVNLGNNLLRYPYREFRNLPLYEFQVPIRSENDILICQRLISAWHLSSASDPGDAGGMWRQLTSGNGQLADALERREPEKLAVILSNMFQEHLVHGLAMGRSTATVARHVPERHSAIWCDRLLRLGEAVGVWPVRSPEQGGIDGPLEMIDIVGEIENTLGLRLYFPPVGAPYGVPLHGTPFPEHSFTHAYISWRINTIGDFNNIAEIGGGYGGLCYSMSRQNRLYTIYDLPFVNLLQAYFLLMSGLPVSLNGEAPSRIRILPWWMINNESNSFDLIINQDSIPEMPLGAAQSYVQRIKQVAPYFYSVNQEAGALNTSSMQQLCVPDLIKAEGGYKRLSRNIFWLRDGYVEELYQSVRA